MEGYKLYRKDRLDTRHAYRFYGGLAIGVRSELSAGVTLQKTDCSEIMWCKISKEFFFERDTFLAVVYVCLQGSTFGARNENVFDALEKDFSKFSELGSVLVCGDFNARTSTEDDFCDVNISDQMPPPSSTVLSSSAFRRRNCDTKKCR